MIKFYLLRHGMKESIPPLDPALTKIGIKQAQATALYLKTIPFKVIVASQKKRTQQTAKIISEQLQIPILTDNRLQERMEWEQRESFDKFLAEWDKTDLDRSYQPLHGDSSQNKGMQMRDVIEELEKKYTDGNILIVTHGGAIGDLLRNLFDDKNLPYLTHPLSGSKYIDILECSITIIEKDNEKYNLLQLGDISHLSIPLI